MGQSNSDFKQSNQQPEAVPRNQKSEQGSGASKNQDKQDAPKSSADAQNHKNKNQEAKSVADKESKSDAKKQNNKKSNHNQRDDEQKNSASDTMKKSSGARLGSGLIKTGANAVKALISAVQTGAKLAVLAKLAVAVLSTVLAPLLLVGLILISVFTALMSQLAQDEAVIASQDLDTCGVYVDRALIANNYGNLNTNDAISGSIDYHDMVWNAQGEGTIEFTQTDDVGGTIHKVADGGGKAISVDADSARLTVARRIYSIMLSYGLRPEQIFGMLGNLQQESNLDPTAVETVFGDDFNIGETKQYFNAFDFLSEHCAISDIHEDGTMTGADRNAYFEASPLIARLGIGLGQWTDIFEDVANPQLEAGVWGRASKLRRYAMLYDKDFNKKSSRFFYNGDSKDYSIWYDLNVQMAYMLDESDVGDSNSSFMRAWAGDFPWSRLITSTGKVRGATKNESGTYDFVADDEQVGDDLKYQKESKYSHYKWRRLGISNDDNFAAYTAEGDKAISHMMPWKHKGEGAYATELLNPWANPVDNESPYDLSGMLCNDMSKPEYSNNLTDLQKAYNLEPDDNLHDDGYYDFRGDFKSLSISSFAKNLEDTSSNDSRIQSANFAYHLLKGLWDDEGMAGHKHKLNVYNSEDYPEGFACETCFNAKADHTGNLYEDCPYSGCDEATHESHDINVDYDGDGQVDFIEHHEWSESWYDSDDDGINDSSKWVVSKTVTHEMRGGDSLHGTGNNKTEFEEMSVCECSERYFRRCYNKVYRHILGQKTTMEFAKQFAALWEGNTSSAILARQTNALAFYELWWRNCVDPTNKALDPNHFQNRSTHGGLFNVELGYGMGIKTGIEHTSDQESEAALMSKNYLDDADLLNCKRYVTNSNDILGIAAITIAGSKAYTDANPDGTDIYKSIQTQVMEQKEICFKACDHTVATAVRWSGLDDNYPVGPTAIQMQYLVASPRWVEIVWSGDESQLEAGDVFIKKDTLAQGSINEPDSVGGVKPVHHTFIYVGRGLVKQYDMSKHWTLSQIEDCNVVEGSFGEYGATFHNRNLADDAKTYHVFRNIHALGSGVSKYVNAVSSSNFEADGTDYDLGAGD